MKKVKAYIERTQEGTYSVYIDLNDKQLNYGIHGEGDTTQEAIADFLSAYEAMKEFHIKKNKTFTEATFAFSHDTASFLEFYSKYFSLSGLSRLTGIHQAQLSHYLTGHRNPSRQTIQKIDNSIHQFALNLSKVKFS